MAQIIFDSEKELEDFIVKKINKEGYCPVSREKIDLCWQQVNLGSYGIADIVKVSVDFDYVHITVSEIKKEKINIDAVIQVIRYMEGIKHFMGSRFDGQEVHVSAELVAPGLSENEDFTYLINAIDNLDLYTISCDLEEGFKAEDKSNGWLRTEPNFNHLSHYERAIRNKRIPLIRAFRDYDQSNVSPIKGSK